METCRSNHFPLSLPPSPFLFCVDDALAIQTLLVIISVCLVDVCVHTYNEKRDGFHFKLLMPVLPYTSWSCPVLHMLAYFAS